MKIIGSKSSDETQSLAMCIWVLPIEGILWPPKDLADVGCCQRERERFNGCGSRTVANWRLTKFSSGLYKYLAAMTSRVATSTSSGAKTWFSCF